MNWKEQLSNVPIIGEPRALTAREWEHNFRLIHDFISTEIIEKIVQDSKTMTPEELTAKWLWRSKNGFGQKSERLRPVGFGNLLSAKATADLQSIEGLSERIDSAFSL